MLIRYAMIRFVQMIPTLLVVTAIVFVLMQVIPGDPALVALGALNTDASAISPEVYQAMRDRLGLDEPIWEQYVGWLARAAQLDLGDSLTFDSSVLAVVGQRLPPTLYLLGVSLVISLVIAIPAGVWAAIRNNTIWDHLATGFVLFGITIPTFWLAIIAMLVFAVYLGWFPAIGYVAPQEDFVRFLRHITLPAVVIGINMATNFLRFQRQDFLEQMSQDYVRTARAKGLSQRLVYIKHVLRNSLITTVTVVGFQIAYLSGLVAVLETIFSYPGIGFLLLQSVFNRDFMVVQGIVLLIVINVMIINLIVDILYAYLDPRVRYS